MLLVDSDKHRNQRVGRLDQRPIKDTPFSISSDLMLVLLEPKLILQYKAESEDKGSKNDFGLFGRGFLITKTFLGGSIWARITLSEYDHIMRDACIYLIESRRNTGRLSKGPLNPALKRQRSPGTKKEVRQHTSSNLVTSLCIGPSHFTSRVSIHMTPQP